MFQGFLFPIVSLPFFLSSLVYPINTLFFFSSSNSKRTRHQSFVQSIKEFTLEENEYPAELFQVFIFLKVFDT